MSTEATLKNPYPDRFPELNKRFQVLSRGIKPNWLTLNNSYTVVGLSMMLFTAVVSTVISGISSSVDGQPDALFITCLRITTGLVLLMLFNYLHVRLKTKSAERKITEFRRSITDETIVQMIVLLRDFTNVDPVASSPDACRPLPAPDKIAISLVKDPSAINVFRASEFLCAEYSRPCPLLFDTSYYWFWETYSGYLKKTVSMRQEIALQDEESLRHARDLERLASLAVDGQPRTDPDTSPDTDDSQQSIGDETPEIKSIRKIIVA